MATTSDNRKYFSLYDLPKNKTTSIVLAECYSAQGIDIKVKKPQIQRDLFKPFYSAIVYIEDPVQYEKAKENMKYFKIDGLQVRALPYDKDLRGEAKLKTMENNVFYKVPKDQDKQTLTYEFVNEKFGKYGEIKSAKISLNPDHSNRGFCFICFADKEGRDKCLADPANAGSVFKFFPKDSRDMTVSLINNLYYKNVPKEMKEDDIKKLFAPFGSIKSLVVLENDLGKYGFACYEDTDKKGSGAEAATRAVAGLQEKDMGNGQKLYIRHFLTKPQREQEKFFETIKYKNSKKRCNLYVKNFPANWGENDLTNIFKEYGDIERVRLEKGFQNNTYAFVCFKMPDACS